MMHMLYFDVLVRDNPAYLVYSVYILEHTHTDRCNKKFDVISFRCTTWLYIHALYGEATW
jgi:hypothetical protein